MFSFKFRKIFVNTFLIQHLRPTPRTFIFWHMTKYYGSTPFFGPMAKFYGPCHPQHSRQNLTHATHTATQPRYPRRPRTHATHTTHTIQQSLLIRFEENLDLNCIKKYVKINIIVMRSFYLKTIRY